MGNMDFDFGSMNSDISIGVNPGSGLNLDLPGESKDELKGENRVIVADMIKANNQNNYFTSMNQKYKTSEFVFYLKPEQIQKAAKDRIFKEMIQGRIDYSIFGFYFNDSKFLENLLIAAQDELINNSTLRDALALYNTTYPGVQNAMNLFSRHDALSRIYSVLFDKLTFVKSTGNVGYLADIQYVLAAYKNAL
jgi:hypothetical protein